MPSVYENLPVTSVSENAFSQNPEITSVTFPESVVTISDKAFYNCAQLTSVTMTGVKVIGRSAFEECSRLATLNLGSALTEIGRSAFEKCKKLVNVKLPSTLKTIGYSAFSECEEIVSVSFPAGLENLGSFAYYNCKKLANISIPDGVKIGRSTFVYTAYASNKSNWTKNVLYCGNHLIDADASGAWYCTIREGTVSISGWAFYYESGLYGVQIPKSVKYIGNEAFYHTQISDKTVGRGIDYKGTKAEWNAIEKVQTSDELSGAWDGSAGAYVVHCTDGDIAKTFD